MLVCRLRCQADVAAISFEVDGTTRVVNNGTHAELVRSTSDDTETAATRLQLQGELNARWCEYD